MKKTRTVEQKYLECDGCKYLMNDKDHKAYLTAKWRQYLEAESADDLEARGYFHGRFDEYVKQNAIPDTTVQACRREARRCS